MAKKDFKIKSNLLQGISDSIGSSQSLQGTLRTENIPLARILLDPDNARKLTVNIDDARNGVSSTDPLKKQKEEEINELRDFGEEIKEDGIIQPITVYKDNEGFMLIAGERRVLSSIIVGIAYIPAIIRNKPSNEYKTSRLQWNENIKRKDLNLWEKLAGIERLVNAYINDIEPNSEINAALISKVANLSTPEAYRYLAILKADDELKYDIQKGNINNLKKAELITKIDDQEIRRDIIKSCEQGMSFEALQTAVKNLKAKQTQKPKIKKNTGKGRQATQVILGKTQNTNVAKQIFNAIQQTYHLELEEEPQWDDLSSINNVFREILRQLEKNKP